MYSVRDRIGSLADRLRDRFGREMGVCRTCGKPTKSHRVGNGLQCHECYTDRPVLVADGGEPTGDRDEAILSGEYEVETDSEPGVKIGVRDDGQAVCRFCREELDDRNAERQHRCRGRLELILDQEGSAQPARFIEPQTHKIGANFTFEADNMAPYHALVSEYGRLIGENLEFEWSGEPWEIVGTESEYDVKSVYWEGKVAPRDDDSAEDGLNEYQIVAQHQKDTRRRVVLKCRPAYPEMVNVDTGEEFENVPSNLPEGIRVQWESSNVDLSHVLPLLRAIFDKLTISPDYFSEPHPWSTIYNLEYYLRVRRKTARRLTKAEGVFERLTRLSSVQRGRGEYKWDNDDIHGAYHAVAVDGGTWERLIEDHRVGTRIKTYHPDKPRREETDDDPLSSPKIEVQLSGDYDGDERRWYNRDGLEAELIETMLNVMSWGGIDVTANAYDDQWVEDDYWTPEYQDRGLVLRPDPTAELVESEEEWAMGQFMAADASSSEKRALEAIVEIGGGHYRQIAEAAEVSVRSVYRALDTFEGIITNDDGEVDLLDNVVAEQLENVFQRMQNLGHWVEKTAIGVTANIESLQDDDDPLVKWIRAHGATVQRKSGGFEFDLSNVERSGYQLWQLMKQGIRAAHHSAFKFEEFVHADFRTRTPTNGERVEGIGWQSTQYRFHGPIETPF